MAAPDVREPAHSPFYRWYVLCVFTLVLALSFADRQLITILIEPIKAEFGASDTEMGFLSGLAFTLFYAGFAVPIARLADRRSRRDIVAASIAVWSVATAACGAAVTFWQLTAARIMVGVGEAGGGPASQSAIADYFPQRQRATALGIYSTGSQLGILLGMFGGALLAHQYGWRYAFVLIGLPGLLLALLVRLTVAEPRRGGADAAVQREQLPLLAVMRQLLGLRAFRLTALAAGFAALSGLGLATWLPSFLVRVHDVELVQAGLLLGIGGTLGGLLGGATGGLLCDRLVKRDVGWQLYLPALAAGTSVPMLAVFLLWPEWHVLAIGGWQLPFAALFIPVNAFLIALWLGPMYAASQNLVAPELRAQSAALMLLITTLIGSGVGPLMVGVLSDAFASIRHALLASLVAMVVGAALFWRAGVHYRVELRGA